jgi:hypothetical protein
MRPGSGLHVERMEVDRVRVDAVVRESPDLRPVIRHAIGVILRSCRFPAFRIVAFGSFDVSTISVAGKVYGCRLTFCNIGCGRDRSTPRLACMRPNSSKTDSLVSSWIAFGSM